MIYTTRLNTTSSIAEFIPEIEVYADIEPEWLNFENGIRVLPAPYFKEPNLDFTLKQRYEPGEKKTFPNGGFEVYEGNGGKILNFDMDQVIVHPFELKKYNYFKSNKTEEQKDKVIDPNKPKAGRGRPPKLDENGNPIPKKEYVPTGGQRGRAKLTDEERAKRELEKANTPKSESKGSRGRKKLSEEEKAKRKLIEDQKLAERQKQIDAGLISGKKGRPSTLTTEQKEERRLAELEKDRLRNLGLLKRGRPSFK